MNDNNEISIKFFRTKTGNVNIRYGSPTIGFEIHGSPNEVYEVYRNIYLDNTFGELNLEALPDINNFFNDILYERRIESTRPMINSEGESL